MSKAILASPSHSLEAVRERLARLLAASVGDATELLWIETRRGEATSLRREEPPPIVVRRTVTVRVSEGPRLGRYTTEDGADGELADALRLALAHARAESPTATPWEPPAGGGANGDAPAADVLFDPEAAALEPRAAKALLERGLQQDEVARLRWATTRAVLVNSRGLWRATALTGAALAIESGRGAGAGSAERAARTFALLAPAELAERARALRSDEEAAAPPAEPVPLVLGPVAAAALVHRLAATGLAAEAFARGGVLGAGDLGREIFSRAFSLVDDGSRPAGLPFPFDFEGRRRGRVELVTHGVLKTPAVGPLLAAELGLPATPHYLGPDEIRPQHLFVEPGAGSREDLLAAAGGGPGGDGLWVGTLAGLGPVEPFGSSFRAICRGVRQIVGGRLGPPVAPFLWQDDLRRVLAGILAVGSDATAVAFDSELRGAVSSPSLAVGAGGLFRPPA